MATKSDPLVMLRADRDTRFSLADQESALRRFLTTIGASSWKASHDLPVWQSKMFTDLHETPAYNLFNRPWVFRGNRFGPIMTLHPNVHYPNFDGLENIIGYLASRSRPTDVYVISRGQLGTDRPDRIGNAPCRIRADHIPRNRRLDPDAAT